MMIRASIFTFFALLVTTGCHRETNPDTPVVPPGISWASLLSDATELQTLARPVEAGARSKMFSSCSDTGKVMLAHLAPKVTGDLDHGFFTEVRDVTNGVQVTLGEFDGPGVVTWVWSANPTGTLLVLIDDQASPALALPFADFLAGHFLPVRTPYASITSFGHNLHFPIVHARHCKLILQAPCRADLSQLYYQVAWHSLPSTSAIHPFDVKEIKQSSTLLKTLSSRILSVSKSTRPASEDGATRSTTACSFEPGKTVELFRATGPQGITAIQLTGKSKSDLANLWIDGFYDGIRTLHLPLHMLAGVSSHLENTQSLPATVNGNQITLRWFMPFTSECRLTGSNMTTRAFTVTVDVWSKPIDATRYPLCFHANDIRNKGMKTDGGNILTLAEAAGPGRIAGTVLGVDSRSDVWWGEGDHLIWMDDSSRPVWHGTGTEDYFGFAWCSQGLFHHPFRGQTYIAGDRSHRIAHMHRYHILDQLPFERWARFQCEAWGLGKGGMDWTTAVIWYSTDREASKP